MQGNKTLGCTSCLFILAYNDILDCTDIKTNNSKEPYKLTVSTD